MRRQISHIRLRSNKYGRSLFPSHYLENQYGTASSLFLTLAVTQEKKHFLSSHEYFLTKLPLSPNDLIKINFQNILKLKLTLKFR